MLVVEFEAAGCDGMYVEGKREMLKIKHRRSVECVVGGYRVYLTVAKAVADAVTVHQA